MIWIRKISYTCSALEVEPPPQGISWIYEATEVLYGLQGGTRAALQDHAAPGPLGPLMTASSTREHQTEQPWGKPGTPQLFKSVSSQINIF